jgi:hypothetical protein
LTRGLVDWMPEVGKGRFDGGDTTRGFGGCFRDLVEEGVSRAEGAEAGGGGSGCNRGVRDVAEPK